MLDHLQKIVKTVKNSDNRFYGVSPQKLQNIRSAKSYSMRDELHDMQNISERLLTNELNLQRISAQTFMQELIPISQNKIDADLNAKPLELDHKILPAFRNYLLRDYYPTMLERYSFEVIRLLKKDRESSCEFLNFFDGSSVRYDGKRWRKPKLVVENIGLMNPLELESHYAQILKREGELEECLYSFFIQLNITQEWNTYIGSRGRFTRLFMLINHQSLPLNSQLVKEITREHKCYLELEKEIKTVQDSIKKVIGTKLILID